MPLYLFNRQDLRKYISQLYFLQSTGRRGTFLSEEQICNCAVVPSHNANGIKVKFFKKEPEIKIGAALQIFLEKENVPLLPSHRENLYLYLLFIGKPPHKFLPAMKERRKQERTRFDVNGYFHESVTRTIRKKLNGK